MIISLLILFILLIGFIYAVLFLLVRFFQSFSDRKFMLEKKFKLLLFLASFLIAALATYFFVFTSPTENYKIAYIEKQNQVYKVTVKGQRLYMVHDPVSLFLRKTYEDSAQYIIPRSEGLIKGQELPVKEGYYKLIGNIIINFN